jgi:hypothetical protein
MSKHPHCRRQALAAESYHQAGTEAYQAQAPGHLFVVRVNRLSAGQHGPSAGGEDPAQLSVGGVWLRGELDGIHAQHRVGRVGAQPVAARSPTRKSAVWPSRCACWRAWRTASAEKSTPTSRAPVRAAMA